MVCLVLGGEDGGEDDDQQQDDHTNNDADAHLHVLPPHLLSYSVGTTAETLGRLGKVVSLVLESVQAFTTLGDLVDVVAHDTDGIVDLLQNQTC